MERVESESGEGGDGQKKNVNKKEKREKSAVGKHDELEEMPQTFAFSSFLLSLFFFTDLLVMDVQVSAEVTSMRRTYKGARLDSGSMPSDPMEQFQLWLKEAIECEHEPEPNAMTLATASADGIPNARMVLLKGVDERGFRFFTNYDSQKGRELAENPKATLVFWWQSLSRSVRVHGSVHKVSPEESAEYFKSRPVGSQIGAIVSAQSQVRFQC